MSEFHFSEEQFQAEIERTRKRQLVKERAFVLLLGPSGTGKSTVISEMNNQTNNERFEYVKATITRPNRPGEIDKTSVSDVEFDVLEGQGAFVVVNGLYGVRYGTPIKGILDPLSRGKTPLLDYPLQTVDALERPEYDTVNFYVYPPSVEEWQERLVACGRDTDGRLESGTAELEMLASANLSHPDIDVSVVNLNGSPELAAEQILSALDQIIQ